MNTRIVPGRIGRLRQRHLRLTGRVGDAVGLHRQRQCQVQVVCLQGRLGLGRQRQALVDLRIA